MRLAENNLQKRGTNQKLTSSLQLLLADVVGIGRMWKARDSSNFSKGAELWWIPWRGSKIIYEKIMSSQVTAV
jgi:hypothetical protein